MAISEKLIPLVIKKCLSNESIPVYGNGEQIRDWIRVEDHVSGLLTVLRKGVQMVRSIILEAIVN